MGRIALAWELGAGHGHLGRLLPVAIALRRRGHDCVFVVRDPHRAQGTVTGTVTAQGFPILQAPIWRGATPRFDPPLSYAGIMRRCGFHAGPALAGLVACWRGLFDLIGPD
ncbi:MAG: glycosyltransferase, partial [Geminicoccaceae bacterium]